METVGVNLPHHKYDIHIGAGLFTDLAVGDSTLELGRKIFALLPNTRVALISDSNVAPHYADPLKETLLKGGYKEVREFVLVAGEEHKTLEQVRNIYDFLVQANCERRTPIMALGGGVVGDTVGFAASSFLRGLPFVQIPTSLLAMIDASVGGKVGVNLPQGKNLVGSFYQPSLVVADVNCLSSLSAREFQVGMAECVKHAILSGSAMIQWLEMRREQILSRDASVLAEMVKKNVSIKAAIVMEDERENGARAWLNLGHTFAHAIEVTTGYSNITHGEAVSLGLVAASMMAAWRNLWPVQSARRIEQLLESFGLPIRAELVSDNDLLQAMSLDKKVSQQRIRFVLPQSHESDDYGRVSVFDDISMQEITDALQYIRS